MQVLEQAVTETGSLDDDKLADYIHKNAFDTIVGKIRFDPMGEWATPRVLMVQFQNVQGNGLEQYLTGHRQVILYPPEYKDGDAGSSRSRSKTERRTSRVIVEAWRLTRTERVAWRSLPRSCANDPARSSSIRSS